MESIIKEAITRADMEGRTQGMRPKVELGQTDSELEEVLQQLKTNIRVVGCGGGGSNTIQRMTEEGIAGAELYALNTDAQHLLHVSVEHKILTLIRN